ncbi:MAG TPA: OmpA family protein [Xanthobacteraceae bacterium]|nr:OmpA family protein [Xanthobacteraceae bacterium]
MIIRLLLVIALLGGASIVPVPASAEEALSPSDIECALDPNCAKPKPQPQQEKTRSLLGRGVTVEGKPAEQPLSVNLYVNFAYNSADLTSDARITLDRLGTALRDPRLAAFSFVIAGHTDAKGGAEFNQKLSERRAEAVSKYLIAQFSISAGRLSAKGYGKSQLLDPTNPEDGVNRRVQIINVTAAAQQRN